MPLQPLFDRVLIRREALADKTEGGIYIPDVAKEKSLRGTVISCGTGLPNNKKGTVRPMEVKPGDKVIFSLAGIEVNVDGEDLLMINEEDILAVVE